MVIKLVFVFLLLEGLKMYGISSKKDECYKVSFQNPDFLIDLREIIEKEKYD